MSLQFAIYVVLDVKIFVVFVGNNAVVVLVIVKVVVKLNAKKLVIFVGMTLVLVFTVV